MITSRVYLLTESFYPPDLGGQEKHAYQLVERLTMKGQEVFVVTRQTDPASADFEHIGTVSVRRIPPGGDLKGKGWRALGPVVKFMVRMLYLLVKDSSRYDIILTCGHKLLPIPAMLARVISGKKYIVRVESGTELLEDISETSLQRMKLSQSSILLRLFRNLRYGLLKRADCVVAISPEIKQQLLTIGLDPRKIRSIPNGIDTDRFCPVSNDEKLRIRKKLFLPEDKIIFTFTGRLAASKGLLLLIKVWKDLVQKYYDIQLLLVGTGKGSFDSCEDELREYIRVHQLEQTVFLPGEADNVWEYLQASDVFVFPSESEGFGISIVEALACGLPMVTTRVGIASELIQSFQNGILVNPKDHQEIQTAIEWILDHKDLWAAIGENARKAISEKYSMEEVAEKYREMFMELQGSENGRLSK